MVILCFCCADNAQWQWKVVYLVVFLSDMWVEYNDGMAFYLVFFGVGEVWKKQVYFFKL